MCAKKWNAARNEINRSQQKRGNCIINVHECGNVEEGEGNLTHDENGTGPDDIHMDTVKKWQLYFGNTAKESCGGMSMGTLKTMHKTFIQKRSMDISKDVYNNFILGEEICTDWVFEQMCSMY